MNPPASAPAVPIDLAAAIKAGGPGKHSIWLIIAVLVAVALGVGGWLWWRKVERRSDRGDGGSGCRRVHGQRGGTGTHSGDQPPPRAL